MGLCVMRGWVVLMLDEFSEVLDYLFVVVFADVDCGLFLVVAVFGLPGVCV